MYIMVESASETDMKLGRDEAESVCVFCVHLRSPYPFSSDSDHRMRKLIPLFSFLALVVELRPKFAWH